MSVAILALSPILKFAFESLEQALEQYIVGSEKSRKFCILHCDQAIELILKEKMRAMGDSIFLKGQYKTIDFYEALNKLIHEKGVKIVEFPNIELIHDLRNVIQHKGASVSTDDTEFYTKMTFDFIKRFAKEELTVELKEHLPERYYEIFEPKEKKSVEAKVSIRLKHAIPTDNLSMSDFLSIILTEAAQLELNLNKVSRKLGADFPQNKVISPREIVEWLISYHHLAVRSRHTMALISDIRNAVAHSSRNITKREVQTFLLAIRELQTDLDNIEKDNYHSRP